MSIPDLCRMTVPPLRRLLAEPLKHAKQIMFLEDHELWYYARRNWVRLVLFRRSLNLKLVLVVYLLILQCIVCLDRYGEVFTKADFIAYENWRSPKSTDVATKLTFRGDRRFEKEKILIDLLRPTLLLLLLTVQNKRSFYVIAVLSLICFRNDSALSGISMPESNDYSSFGYEWRHNFLFRLSIVNEAMIRVVVLYLVWQRYSTSNRIQPRTDWWHISLGDLMVFILLLAATIAIVR
jgi:hypothetical protein